MTKNTFENGLAQKKQVIAVGTDLAIGAGKKVGGFMKYLLLLSLFAMPAVADDSFTEEQIVQDQIEGQVAKEEIDQFELDADFAKRQEQEARHETAKNKSTIKRLEAKKASLEATIKKYTELAQKQNAENAVFAQKSEVMKQDVAQKESRMAQLKDELVRLKDQKAELQRQIADSNALLRAERAEASGMKAQANQTKRQTQAYKSTLSRTQKQIAAIKANKKSQAREFDRIRSQSAAVERELARLTKINSGLLAQNQALKNSISQGKKMLAEKQARKIKILRANQKIKSDIQRQKLQAKNLRNGLARN